MPTLIAHAAQGGGNTAATTVTLGDTTGATLIVVGAQYYTGGGANQGSITISDNKGNTYTRIGTDVNEGGGSNSRVAYCALPTVGAGHTVTITDGLGSGIFAPIGAEAWDSTGASPLDQTNADSTTSPGSITPTQNGCIVITQIGCNGGTPTAVDSGFVIDDTVTGSGLTLGYGQASLVQSTAAAINLTWTRTTGTECARVTSFLPSAGPATAVKMQAMRGWSYPI